MAPSDGVATESMTDGPRAGPSAGQASLLRRLHRLEGQAGGIIKMIEADRPVPEVLQQFSALLAATREASVEYALTALRAQLGEIASGGAELDDVIGQFGVILERTSRLP